MFELFYTHPYCKACRKKIWIWQNGVRPSDAYHYKCLIQKIRKTKKVKNV